MISFNYGEFVKPEFKLQLTGNPSLPHEILISELSHFLEKGKLVAIPACTKINLSLLRDNFSLVKIKLSLLKDNFSLVNSLALLAGIIVKL